MIQLSKERLAESSKKALALGFVLAALSASFLLAYQQPAYAADFTVNTTSDTEDGSCNLHCSLREAIIAANANSGADTIKFDISGSGVKTIKPASELPPCSMGRA